MLFSWEIGETWLRQEQMSFRSTFLNEKASFYPLLESLLQLLLAVTAPDVALKLHFVLISQFTLHTFAPTY